MAIQIFELLKERVTYPHEFAEKSLFLFGEPKSYDEKVVRKKWDADAARAMTLYGEALAEKGEISPEEAKELFFSLMEANSIPGGKYMQALRLTITGEGSGPDLMTIISIMGGQAVNNRIRYSVSALGS